MKTSNNITQNTGQQNSHLPWQLTSLLWIMVIGVLTLILKLIGLI